MHAAILFLATLLTQGAPPLDEGLGTHHRKITTDSPLAQKYFDQGLRLLYSFNRDESRKSFAEAARLDPKSPMAWWGVAVSYGPDINITFVIPEWAKAATAAIHRAKALSMRGTPVERALIDAAYARYTDPQPEDRTALDRLYAAKMRAVWHRFPKDTDVGALFAQACLISFYYLLLCRDVLSTP